MLKNKAKQKPKYIGLKKGASESCLSKHKMEAEGVWFITLHDFVAGVP